MPKYIAKQSVGHFRPGQEIEGLDDERIQALLASGAIEEYKAPVQTPSDESKSDLKKLLGEVADLKATNTQLTEEKDKALGEVADLKAKVTKLEADLAAAVAKTPKADKTADKGTTDSK
jgi:predicted nuclease with TOPRIM domain